MTTKEYSLYLEKLLLENNIKFKVYYSKTNSCYIRIKNLKNFCIRLSDHNSNWRYSYNIDINQYKDDLIVEINNLLENIKRRLINV